MAKGKGGFIGQDGLNAPDSPTSISASGGDQSADVSFTAPSDVGGSAITGYVATSNDGIGATGTSSPITVTGLTNGSSYTFNVWAINAFGYSAPSDASGSVTPAQLSRALFAGDVAYVNNVSYVEVATIGNASDFGDLTNTPFGAGMTGNETTAIVGGGFTGSTSVNVIQSRVFATTGNFSDFGDLTVAVGNGISSCSSPTRGVYGGGLNTSNARVNNLQYITIASAGNATDFGDLVTARDNMQGGMSNGTRGICGYAGYNGSATTNQIDYITIASTGNASDFGDAQLSSFIYGCSSNSTRGIAGKGTTIDYITIATLGNASDFGDNAVNRGDCTSASNQTRTLFTGSGTEDLDYITIATLGNTSDFGTLPRKHQQSAALCQGHGGAS